MKSLKKNENFRQIPRKSDFFENRQEVIKSRKFSGNYEIFKKSSGKN